MKFTSEKINKKYLDQLNKSKKNDVFFKIRKYWWKNFEGLFKEDNNKIVDQLDYLMTFNESSFLKSAEEFAKIKGFSQNTSQYTQRVNQYLKSNTGKMFERLIGLVIAHYLLNNNSNYCIWPFRKDLKNVCNYLNIDDFKIKVDLGKKKYFTKIDSDLIIFNPLKNNDDIYLVSVKTTLKDRFHNVPFWNLLRLSSINEKNRNIQSYNKDLLKKISYIVICTDLAKEQPDFNNPKGPRELLCIDAALLDGAFVTSKKAKGLGSNENCLGVNRDFPFYKLSSFLKILI